MRRVHNNRQFRAGIAMQVSVGAKLFARACRLVPCPELPLITVIGPHVLIGQLIACHRRPLILSIIADTKGAVRAIADVTGIINQINDISNSIASAVEEQTVTTNEINRSMGEAARGVSDITHNMTGVVSAAQNTTTGATEAQCAAQDLSKNAAKLQAVLAHYKL